MLPLTTSVKVRRVVGMMVFVAAHGPGPRSVSDRRRRNRERPLHPSRRDAAGSDLAAKRLARGGPVGGYFQPAEIQTPGGGLNLPGRRVETFVESRQSPFAGGDCSSDPSTDCGFSQLPDSPGAELFPTVELIDRLYPPAGAEYRFPIVIQITREDIQLARDGKDGYPGPFMSRIPVPRFRRWKPREGGLWFDVGAGDDPAGLPRTPSAARSPFSVWEGPRAGLDLRRRRLNSSSGARRCCGSRRPNRESAPQVPRQGKLQPAAMVPNMIGD